MAFAVYVRPPVLTFFCLPSLLRAIQVLNMAGIESIVTWHGVKNNRKDLTIDISFKARLQIMKSKCVCSTQNESQLHWDRVQS